MAMEPVLGGSHVDGGNKAPCQGVRFWGIFVCLCMLAFISALDVAIITTALPSITASIGGARQYVWIANSFTVASSILQPLFGQLSDLFGRRIPFISSVALFAIGSGVAGGAKNAGILITGRTIQGAGAGGMYVLLDIVCCDLVPLRERGKYLGLMFSWSGIAAALGPPVGGAIAQSDWRWIFWLNIPICGLALSGLLIFMRMKKGHENPGKQGFIEKTRRLDIVGSFIFIPSMISLLIGLVEGGTEHAWSSWRIIVPLVLGALGWVCFHIHQLFAKHPSVPPRLFGNRTSAAALFLTFTSSVLVQALSYFLPVYFQAVQATTVLYSGTLFLPFAMGSLAFAVAAGILLSKFGKYKPLHGTAFALTSIAFGLLTLLGPNTPKVAYVWYELIASAGAGLVLSVLLPAVMAPLPENYVASASATYSFIRTFGYIWGVTIPGIIFNATFDHNLSVISDPALRDRLRGGAAYAFASQVHSLRDTLSATLWNEMAEVYVRSLRVIWWVCLGISLVSFFAVWIQRSLELRKEHDTEYGLDNLEMRGTLSDCHVPTLMLEEKRIK
ncbi:hypothetical protein M434DRAFT_38839 [Hypoxylon sp. CO27-5]|nr:hypothetical protein M434DRAFT_38839 [Hypoxylon sp. CO27-5]